MAAFRLAKAIEKGEAPPPVADNAANAAVANATAPSPVAAEDAANDVPPPPGSNATDAP